MTRIRFKGLLLAGAASAALSGQAFAALDGQDLLAKINAAYAAGSGVLKAESIEVNGDDVVLKGTTFTATGPQEKSIALGNLTLQDVTEADGGAYQRPPGARELHVDPLSPGGAVRGVSVRNPKATLRRTPSAGAPL